MLYSQTLEDRQFTFFRSMLWHVLNGEDSYRQFVDPIVSDAHKLSSGVKNVYTIDRDNYHIIMHLVKKDESYFQAINPSSLEHSDYEYIDSMMVQQRHVSFV